METFFKNIKRKERENELRRCRCRKRRRFGCPQPSEVEMLRGCLGFQCILKQRGRASNCRKESGVVFGFPGVSKHENDFVLDVLSGFRIQFKLNCWTSESIGSCSKGFYFYTGPKFNFGPFGWFESKRIYTTSFRNSLRYIINLILPNQGFDTHS